MDLQELEELGLKSQGLMAHQGGTAQGMSTDMGPLAQGPMAQQSEQGLLLYPSGSAGACAQTNDGSEQDLK